jgi:hypothetical protein
LKCVWEQRYLLNPGVYGFYAVQLFSHKVLRRLMAIPLLGLFFSAPLLWKQGLIYRLATIGQMAFHSAAALGYRMRDKHRGRLKFLSLPYHLDMVNLATLAGVSNLLRGVKYDVWLAERADRDELSLDISEGD